MSRVIEVSALDYTYSDGTPFARQALTDVSFGADSGELIALIGATGSGKSTLLQILAGLLLPRRGQVHVFGRELTNPRLKENDLDKHRRRVAIALQRPEDMLFKTYLGDDVAYGPANYGFSGADLAWKVKTAMESAGLSYSRYKDRRIDGLSGGEKRKGALAGVLALDPDILLLDEPAAGLDSRAAEELFTLIAELRHRGKTILFSTHDMDQALKADTALLFIEGRIPHIAPPGEIFAQSDAARTGGLLLPDSYRLAHELKGSGIDLGVEHPPADPDVLAPLIARALNRRRPE